jgi:hypothetical protein
VILHIEHVNTLMTGLPAEIYCLAAANHVGRQRQPAVDVGMPWYDRDQMQVRVVRNGLCEEVGHPLRPQILVF